MNLPLRVGSYVLESEFSKGSSYSDYRAHHVTLSHHVLVRKEHWPSQLSKVEDNPSFECLRRARQLQAEIRHPRISPVVDFFEHERAWYSVFAHAAGTPTLSDTLEAIECRKRPNLGLNEFVELSAGITAGLAAVHQVGFAHRTLGANNILVHADDGAILGDLGCATPLGETDGPANAFMRVDSAAPEQLGGIGSPNPAMDNWALGTVLFRLRYGHHPFWIDTPRTLHSAYVAILENPIAFPEPNKDVPPPLSDQDTLIRRWLARLLELNPKDRYGDALEAQRDLKSIAASVRDSPPLGRAFVAMPFAKHYEDIWRAVWSACADCQMHAEQARPAHRREDIWEEIKEAISTCDFMIAIASPQENGSFNANVMLEIGFARALNKPLLLLTSDPEQLPFDIRTQRALRYDASSIGSGSFHNELLSYLDGILRRLPSRR